MNSPGNVTAAFTTSRCDKRCKISQKHHIENEEHKETVRATEGEMAPGYYADSSPLLIGH